MAGRIRLRVSGPRRLFPVVAAFVPTPNSRQAVGTTASTTLLVAQCFHRIETGSKVRANERGNRANEKRGNTNDSDVSRDDFCRDRRKLIDFPREDLDMKCRGQPVTELVAVTA